MTVDGPDVVILSRPSAPRKTKPRTPRSASTWASNGTMASLEQPRAWAVTWAGLLRGPRKLNTVGTPSCLRTGATYFMDGW